MSLSAGMLAEGLMVAVDDGEPSLAVTSLSVVAWEKKQKPSKQKTLQTLSQLVFASVFHLILPPALITADSLFPTVIV